MARTLRSLHGKQGISRARSDKTALEMERKESYGREAEHGGGDLTARSPESGDGPPAFSMEDSMSSRESRQNLE